jgi:hypothetical protein
MVTQGSASKLDLQERRIMRVFLIAVVSGVLLFVASTVQAEEKREATKPTVPTKVLKPLENFKVGEWVKFSEPPGKFSNGFDLEKVYSVKNGVLHISGHGNGYMRTKRPFANYHLSIEYKWGEFRTNQSKYVRNSGVLLHGSGKDSIWPTSLEVQLAQGCEGDFIVIRGPKRSEPFSTTITSDIVIAEDKKTRWQRGGKPTKYSGRQFWWNRHQPFFKEHLDTRGKHDVASPKGEWTKVECICNGDRVTVKINGQTVNECYNAKPSAGSIILQNEKYEVFFRNMEIRPLKP